MIQSIEYPELLYHILDRESKAGIISSIDTGIFSLQLDPNLGLPRLVNKRRYERRKEDLDIQRDDRGIPYFFGRRAYDDSIGSRYIDDLFHYTKKMLNNAKQNPISIGDWLNHLVNIEKQFKNFCYTLNKSAHEGLLHVPKTVLEERLSGIEQYMNRNYKFGKPRNRYQLLSQKANSILAHYLSKIKSTMHLLNSHNLVFDYSTTSEFASLMQIMNEKVEEKSMKIKKTYRTYDKPGENDRRIVADSILYVLDKNRRGAIYSSDKHIPELVSLIRDMPLLRNHLPDISVRGTFLPHNYEVVFPKKRSIYPV